MRRGVAFLVDGLIFQFAVLVFILLLYTLMGWGFGFGAAMSCETAPDGPLVRLIEKEWLLAAGEQRNNQLCTISNGGQEQRILFSTVVSNTNGVTSSRNFSLSVDEAGNAISPDASFLTATYELIKALFFFGLFIFLLAYITSRGKRTPGKKLLSLRIIETTTATPSLKRCLTREIWKFLPSIIVVVIATIVMPRTLQPFFGDAVTVIHAARDMAVPNFSALIVFSVVSWICSFIWWFGPFIVWRGQTFYDRIAGCFVVRSETKPATPT